MQQAASSSSSAAAAQRRPSGHLLHRIGAIDMAEIVRFGPRPPGRLPPFPPMTDTDYMDRAEALLRQVEAGCDRINDETDADVDSQRVGGMVTLTFRNGSQIVVNLQKPLQEVWLAARAGGFHYRFDGTHWMDTKGAGEFFDHLGRCASEQAGQPLDFKR
jgi:CyaY protein